MIHRRTIQLRIAALALVATSCHSADNYLTSPDNINPFLSVEAPATLRADGIDTGTIAATITERSPGALEAEFTVLGGGMLSGNGSEGSTVKVPFSAQNVAVATLRSDAQPKRISVQVKIGNVAVTRNIEFVEVRSTDVFTLTASPPSLPANGYSDSLIQAVLMPVGSVAQRGVVFTTTGGTFAGDAGTGRITVTANEQGVAAVRLISDLLPRTVTVTATAREHSQSMPLSFTPVSPSDLIALRTSRSDAVADDDDLVRLTASIPRELAAAKKRITFRTSRGVFQNGQTTFEDAPEVNGELAVDLKSSSSGVALVSASVEGARAETQIRFDTAQPTQIVVTVTAPTLQAAVNESVEVRAILQRSPGRVSEGMFPLLSAVTANGTSIGTFFDRKGSDASFLSTARFTVGPTTYRGPVTIRVAAPDGSVSASTTIEIVDP